MNIPISHAINESSPEDPSTNRGQEPKANDKYDERLPIALERFPILEPCLSAVLIFIESNGVSHRAFFNVYIDSLVQDGSGFLGIFSQLSKKYIAIPIMIPN